MQRYLALAGVVAPLAFTVGVVVAGLTWATGLRRSRIGHHAPVAVPLLVGYFGLMVVVQGLSPCTPGCAEGTLADLVHGLAATAGFLAFVAATLLLWSRLRSSADGPAYGTYSGLTGVFTLVFMVAWFVAGAVDPERLHAGALQRLFVGAVLVWLGVTGARLLRVAVARSQTLRRS